MNRNAYVLSLFVGIAVISISIAGYVYYQYRAVQSKTTKGIVLRVGALIDLPKNEEPSIATVTNSQKLASQPFFSMSKNGDVVLIYKNAQKAILFRPSINKIVEISPLSFGPKESSPAAITVALYNGTTIAGFTKLYESELLAKATNAVVVSRDNASRNTYDTSVLVDVHGQSAKAALLSESLGIPVSKLPSGEATPEADILIILGSDKK